MRSLSRMDNGFSKRWRYELRVFGSFSRLSATVRKVSSTADFIPGTSSKRGTERRSHSAAEPPRFTSP